MVLFFSNNTDLHMNFFIFVDDIILSGVKSLSRLVYRTFGIDNFKFAKLICGVGYLACTLGIVLKFLSIGWYGIIATVFFSSLMFPFFFYFFHLVFKSQEMYKRGFINETRLTGRTTRVFALICTIHLLYFIPITFVQTINEFLGILLVWQSTIWGWAISQYLSALEPEDPTDSFLKKLWEKFKSLFEVRALPQPA
jgi:hypothetical protein